MGRGQGTSVFVRGQVRGSCYDRMVSGGRKPLKTSRTLALQSAHDPAQQLSLWDSADHAGAWQVRQSRRARRLAARVFRDGSVEIVVPLRTNATTVSAFVARYRQWIERQQARMQPSEPEPFPPRQISFAAVGQLWHCELSEQLRPGRVQIACEPRQEQAGMLQLGGDGAHQAQLVRSLRAWLVERARLELTGPLAALAEEIGTIPVQLKVRRQRTRWGSCTAGGAVSLNCCALFQRPEVLRYLLVHELAHLRHMNHSARFWAHVERYEPDYRLLDRELGKGWQRVPHWALGARHH
jgi:predicted metal-dependent hydrolase